MKTTLLILFSALYTLPCAAQYSQIVTILSGNSFSVLTNQIVSVIGYDWSDKPTVQGYFHSGAAVNLTPYGTTLYTGSASSQSGASSQIPQFVTGMTNIAVPGYGPGWATFKIETPTTATVVSNYVPADAIVIPASTTGNVQIILESSPDLVNWTAANPGIYGASAGTNRFFRVRAAVNP